MTPKALAMVAVASPVIWFVCAPLISTALVVPYTWIELPPWFAVPAKSKIKISNPEPVGAGSGTFLTPVVVLFQTMRTFPARGELMAESNAVPLVIVCASAVINEPLKSAVTVPDEFL